MENRYRGARKAVTIQSLIAAGAPPRPPCFPDDETWRDWLATAHVTGIRIVSRRQCVDVEHRTEHYVFLQTQNIDYCQDCSPANERLRTQQGTCVKCVHRLAEDAAAREVDKP